MNSKMKCTSYWEVHFKFSFFPIKSSYDLLNEMVKVSWGISSL